MPPAAAPPMTMNNIPISRVPILARRGVGSLTPGQCHRGGDERKARQERPDVAPGDRSGQPGGRPSDQRDRHRESQDDRDPSRNGSALREREQQRGNHVAADQRGQQQQTDDCAGAVRRGKRSNHLSSSSARPAFFAASVEGSAHIDLAEEALRRNGDDRVGRLSPGCTRRRCRPVRRLAIRSASLEYWIRSRASTSCCLDRADHRRRPGHAERHVARHQSCIALHQAPGEDSGQHQRQRQYDKPLLVRLGGARAVAWPGPAGRRGRSRDGHDPRPVRRETWTSLSAGRPRRPSSPANESVRPGECRNGRLLPPAADHPAA